MSKRRDWERARKHKLVIERGAAEVTPRAPKRIDARWDSLAESRGWTRPEVKDWRDECRKPYGMT